MSKEESTNKLLIALISLLILIIIGGAAGFIYYINQEETAEVIKQEQKQSQTVNEVQQEASQQVETLAEVGPLYPLEPFTVNLQSSNTNDVYLKITLSLELSNKELSKELDAKIAVIRNNIILVLSNKSVTDLSSDAGKAALCDEIKEQLNPLLDDGEIKNVYIVSFIIQ